MLKTILAPLAGAFFMLAWAMAPAHAQSGVPTAVAVCGSGVNGVQTGHGSTLTVDLNGTLCTNASGGGGSAATIADCADVAEGCTADPAWISGAGTVIGLLKALVAQPASSAITNWAGGVLGAMANYGTSPGAVLVPGMNSFVTGAANFAASAAAIPASLGAIGVSDGSTSCSGGPCLIAPTALTVGTFGTPSTQVLSTQNNDPCSYAAKSSVKIAITSATTTAMVAVSGSLTVYVCGFDFTISEVVTTANTLKFESGTGSACASPVADLTGLYGAGGVTAAAPIHVVSAGNGSSTVFSGGASNGVCAVTAIGATAFFEGVLTYVQQ